MPNYAKIKEKWRPYPTHAKKTRRDEVFRLHFDYGYSARKIAEMMKINRNTVNADIMYCYSQLQKDDYNTTPDDWIKKVTIQIGIKKSQINGKIGQDRRAWRIHDS